MIVGRSSVRIVNFQDFICEFDEGRHVIKLNVVDGLHCVESKYIIGDGRR